MQTFDPANIIGHILDESYSEIALGLVVLIGALLTWVIFKKLH